MHYKSWLLKAIAIFFLCLAGNCVLSENKAVSEYELKAAYIYNFAKFIEWPPKAFADNESPLIIGVLGDDPFGRILDDAIRDKTINGRKIVVKRYKRARDAEQCHILFISASEKADLPSIIDDLKGSSVLTVGDMDKFASRGGMIGFVIKDKKLEFEINLEQVNKAGLKVSSKLLKLAKVV